MQLFVCCITTAILSNSHEFPSLFVVSSILDKTFVDFSTLVQFLFTKSETELDYFHQKVNISIKIPQTLGLDGEYPAGHPRAKF